MTETLDYSRPGSRRGRRRPSPRRLIFDAIVVGLFLGAVIAFWKLDAILAAKKSFDVWSARRACLNHTLPADVGVYIEDTDKAADARMTGHHQTGALSTPASLEKGPKVALYQSPQLARHRDVNVTSTLGGRESPIDPSSATVFLHERSNPAAGAHLVTVELFTSDRGGGLRWLTVHASVDGAARTYPDVIATFVFGLWLGSDDRLIVFAAQPDPADAAHFTTGYRLNGNKGTIDGYLRDNGTIDLVPREGFVQEVNGIRTWKP